jgi:hypothetical protein
MYPNNMYQYQPKASPPASAASNYPVHPDVRLKRLPFFDLMGELLKPSSLGMKTAYCWSICVGATVLNVGAVVLISCDTVFFFICFFRKFMPYHI